MPTQRPLRQRTVLSIMVCIVLFLPIEAVPMLVLGLNPEDIRPALVRLALNLLLWFVLMPFVLRLPNGGESFQQYLSSIGLRSRFPLIVAIMLALLLYGVWAGSQLVVARALGWNSGISLQSHFAGWLRALDSGIFEEICVRGVILAILLKKLKERPAILISSALFGLGHLVRIVLGSPLTDELIVMSYTFMGGIFWAYIVIKTGSLIPSILLHVLIDATAFILTPGQLASVGLNTLWLVRRLVAAIIVLVVCRVVIPLLPKARAYATETHTPLAK